MRSKIHVHEKHEKISLLPYDSNIAFPLKIPTDMEWSSGSMLNTSTNPDGVR